MFAHRRHVPKLIPDGATRRPVSSNPDGKTLERRLAAVERAVGDGGQFDVESANGNSSADANHPGIADNPADDDHQADPADTESLEERLTTLETRFDELDAAVQAVRGFLGGVDAVNDAVESRADAAIAAVDRLEHRLDDADIGDAKSERSRDRAPGSAAESEPGVDAGDTGDRTLRSRLDDGW